MIYAFQIDGNQEDSTGNPIPYFRQTQGSKWSPGAKRYQAWKEHARSELLLDNPGLLKIWVQTGKPFDVPRARLEIEIEFRGENHADPDNIAKGLLDAFFKNDKHVDVQTCHSCKNAAGKIIGKIIVE